MDIVDYLRSAEFPVLLVERPHGAVNGERYLAQWKAEWEKLIAKAMLFSAQRTDCAGWLRVDNSGHDPWGIVCQAHGH